VGRGGGVVNRNAKAGVWGAEGRARENGETWSQYLTFVIADEVYGIPIETVAEIIGLQQITTVPDRRPYVKGVINLRGTVIPVIDVRVRLAMDPVQVDERSCIVVVQLDQALVGLLVDRIAEVIDVVSGEIETAPRRRVAFIGESMVTGFVQKGGGVRILIDLARLLEDGAAGAEGAAERGA
jgi:purine-binding chemotaxis protein CheW